MQPRVLHTIVHPETANDCKCNTTIETSSGIVFLKKEQPHVFG